MPVDVDFLADSFGSAQKVTGPPPSPVTPTAGPDVDFLGQAFLAAPPTRQLQLRQEKSALEPEARAADIAMRFDPLGTFFRGLRASGNVLAGAGEDVLTGQILSFPNLQSALSTYEPTPYEQELAKDRGVAAGLKSGVIGMVKTAPTLGAAAAITAVTKLPPAVVYPSIFAGETYEATSDPYQALKSGTLGAAYLGVGQLVKPIAAGLINRFGLVNNPTAQKAVETTVDQALLQAFGQVLNLPEYAHMTPEEIKRAAAESFTANLVFAIPRVIGHASGAPSEYEAAIRQETARLGDYFQGEHFKELGAAETPEAATGAAVRAGIIPIGPERTPAERTAAIEEERQAGQRGVEAAYQLALRTTPSRRLAAQFAAEQGIPVEVKQPAPAEAAPAVLPATEAAKVKAEATAPEAGARITLRNNIAADLLEFTLERMRRGVEDPHTGELKPARLVYNPTGKAGAYLSVRGQTQHTSYQVPLSELPAGSWTKTKEGIDIDKQAILDFLNNNERRLAARNTHRNAAYFTPEDIDVIQGRLPGRPATGAGTPLRPVPLQDLPKVQKKVGQPVGTRRQMLDITRKAFDELRSKNPQVVEQLLGRRPEELDEPFWNGIRDELMKSDWVAKTENPLATAEALIADLRRLKEGGDLEWLAAIDPDMAMARYFDSQRLNSDDVAAFLGLLNERNAPAELVKYFGDLLDFHRAREKLREMEKQVESELGKERFEAMRSAHRRMTEGDVFKSPEVLAVRRKIDERLDPYRNILEDITQRFATETSPGHITTLYDLMHLAPHPPMRGDPMPLLGRVRDIRRWTNELTALYSKRHPETKASLAPKGWEGITGAPARAAQEAANLREARTLVDDPNNGLSEEARAVLRDILDSPVAAYLNGRQIRFRLADSSAATQGAGAFYSPAEQMITIIRRSNPLSGAHEFFHPLWEMIQDGDRVNVRTWRDSAIAEAMRTATGKDLLDLQKLAAEEMRYTRFLDEGIADKFYKLSSTEEFFAWMLTDRFGKDRQGIWGQAKEILASQDAFLAKVRQIIGVIFDSIRQRVPGLRTQADILQRTILDGKYDVLPTPESEGSRLVQAAIDERFDELKDKGSHILRAGPGDVEIELDINKKQLMALVGPQMYSKPIVEVATKELLQNAFDTARSAGATYNNPGTIEIKTDYGNRTLMVKDTGTGMTPEIIRTAFFTIGGTYKTGSLENTSGGLGLAKMAFILGSEHVRVESNRNGLKSVVDASSDQIRSSKFKIQTERTDEPNGTTVTVKIPENYTDAYGEQKSIYFNNYPNFLTQPLIGPVRVIFNGAELPIGVKLEGWQKENEFNFGWGRIDLYIDPRENRDYPTTHVLSAGLKQFEADPYGWDDKKLPYNLILDVRPKVKTDNAAYPFNNQREGWRATIKEDVDAMYTFLKRMAVEQELLQAKEAFTSIRQLEKVDPMKDWTPEEMADMERRYFRKKSEPPPPIIKPKEVESVDFRGPDVVIHYKDGTAITESKQEYVRKTFEAKREIDLKKTEIDVSDMDPSVPNLHNNVAVEFDDIPRAGTLITETGNVLLNFMREWGKKVGDEYEQLTDASITGWFGGISFDKNYRGLNMVKPMRAIWFNLGLFSSAGRSSPAAAASEALHIFIHEITHVAARSEGAEFTAELANNYARLRSADIPIEIFEGTLDKIFTTNWEAFNEINDRLQNYNTRNRAESFQSSSAVGAERPGEAAGIGAGASPINAPGVGGVPEQGRTGIGRAGPADRAAGPIGDILAGQSRAEPPSISRSRGTQAALESREKVEEYVKPLEETETPERFRAMASTLNKGLVSPTVADRFFALPMGINLELKDVFTGRIGTHQEGPTFREVMADPNRTPEEKSNYSRYALMEWLGYQNDRKKVIDRRDKTLRDLDEATLKAIAAIPETNEAELRAVISLGTILDRIKAERERTAEGAERNTLIGEGIEHLDELNDLLRQPLAMSRALRGIADVVGRAALTAERRGEEVLELISQRSGFPGLSAAEAQTPRGWIRALSAHLARMEDPAGARMINASQDVIEATLWGLRQVGDYRQELLEARLTEDGTLRRFNADYLNDLRSRTPRGFDAILKTYATAQVESDALRSAARRLNNRILTLEERRGNLEQAVTFLTDHDANPEFVAFGRDVVQTTGAMSGVESTAEGSIVTFKHPLTGDDIRVDMGFSKAESIANIERLKNLALAGLQYAAMPNAEPLKAAWWTDFAEHLENYLLVASPDYELLKDPLIDPLRVLTKSKYALIAETSLSRIPGIIPLQTTRAIEAFAIALKTKNAFEKDKEQGVLDNNEIALRSHPAIKTIRQWRDEVAGPIIDSRQHYGQTPYRVGDRIAGFGHVITAEDMKAVRSQYEYDQFLIKLAFKSGYTPAVAEAPGRIKEHERGILRFPLSQGPGTTTRFLPDESRRLPEEWKVAVERNTVDAFLNSGDNFVRVVLGHVLEDERNYVLIGKGRFAGDYKRIRAEKQTLDMPQSLDEISQFIADLHNEHLGETEEPATSGDVRRALIEEVSNYMKRVGEDNAVKKATEARVDIVSHENEYTQPRGGKIAPGTLYRYGVTDRIDMIRKGNNAVEFYSVRYRDMLRQMQNALLAEKKNLLETLNKEYGGEGWKARRQAGAAIAAGDNPVMQRHQMTIAEINRNIDRVGKLLESANAIIRRREEFYGDDISNRLFSPWFNATVGTVLLAPKTWLVNGASGDVMWGLKAADVRNGGWIGMPFAVLKDHVKTFMRTVQLRFTPKDAKERAIKKLIQDNPQLIDGIAEHFTGILQEVQDREQLRRMGVVDSHSVRDGVGWDSERPLGQNFRGVWDALHELRTEPNLSVRKEVFGALGMMPRAWTILARKVGMRQVDNWLNVRSIAFANALAESLRVRAIKSFDARLEQDANFRRIYEQYGDNYKQFAIALAGEAGGQLLTPAELTGRFNPISMDKAAVQLRRTFQRNNDPVDLVMLKYWWNKKHANGDRNAPFMTQAQRWALQFALAEDVNMGTPASRPTWFMGSKERQLFGVLSQWWLWNTDRLQDIYSKVRGQRTLAVRYMPAVLGFLAATAVASLLSNTAGQKANDALFNTISANPGFWDAETDEERLRILLSVAANYWGAAGSIFKMFTDTPGKLGYRNPILLVNFATDLLGAGAKMYQSGDVMGPSLDLLARYSPPLRAIINRLPSREGLVEVRNAANALRAATPESIEAKRRQPSSGTDIRATPMTPLYNAILNSAAAGDWASADESFAKAVEQARAGGNPNPEQAIISAIRTRSPETSVYTRALTDEERQQVYSRLSPENRATVDKANQVFADIASRYGGGVTGTARGFAGGTRFGAVQGAIGTSRSQGLTDAGSLSLSAPRGVRSGFRSRSLRRGLRTRSLLRGGLRQPRLRSSLRMRRLA